ncbi:MAG TPA: ATP-binding protein [Terriglobales bacterium]|nr:ATP-binding protein [Terriglobales bacterium]
MPRSTLAMVSTTAKILIVDDEAGVLLTTCAILQQEGYDVEAAASGVEAVEAIRQRHYDLVLTDLKMPGIDGLGVLAEVRKRSPLTVTVMMTGYGSVVSALDAVQLGAYEYLLKPIEVEDLKQAVRRSLERKRLSEIDTLYRISWTVTQSQHPASMAAEISDAVRGVLGLDYACLLTCQDGQWQGNGPPTLGQALDSSSLRRALQRGLIVTDQDHEETAAAWAQNQQVRSFSLVPGIVGSRLVCVLCAHNGQRPYEFHASAVRFLQGLASQTALALENAALIRELTSNNEELGAANRKLQELDKLKSNFLSVATHELRTPLSVILGYNAMLEESLQDRLDESERQTLTESIAACKRLIRMVNSMLDISQIESGKMKMEFAIADLRNLVNGVAALFQQEARARRLHLSVELPARPLRVQVDAERIEQVLINLVGNAVKFTSAGGAITIRARHQPERRQVEISVQDSGLGIAPEDHERIFDEFAQVRNAQSDTSRDGSGLGLAIAKRIVEAHHGQLRVESTPGKGSTFFFTLPLKAARATDDPILNKAVPA